MTPTAVAWYAAFAAAAAGLGPLLAREPRPGDRFMGLTNALAAGMMLGLAYPLTRDGLETGTVSATLAASLAVVLLFLVHVWFRLDGEDTTSPVRVLIGASVHSAPEGVALGVACAIDHRFGAVVALTLALHNVGEGVVLSSSLARRQQRARVVAAAALSNLPQVMLATGSFVLAEARPTLRPALLGASAGSLIYLSLADLLPSGYLAAGRTAIAVVVIAASGIVAFVGVLS